MFGSNIISQGQNPTTSVKSLYALEQISTFRIKDTSLTLIDAAGVERLEYNAVILGTILQTNEDQLPDDTVVIVQLKELISGKSDGQLIAEKYYEGITQLPIAFSLAYNPKQITENHVYLIDVQIDNKMGSPIFFTPSPPHVITFGNPSDVIIRIEQVE